MTFPEDLRYTREHEWAREQGGVVTVGIFARQRARICLLGTEQGVKTLAFD